MKIIVILLFFIPVMLYAQEPTEVNFDLVNEQPVTTVNLTNLKLPLDISFTGKFKGKTIRILDKENNMLALEGVKFGDSNFTLTGENYILQIDESGKINPEVSGNKKIETNAFLLKIGNSNPITITVSNNNKAISPKINFTEIYSPGNIYYDAIKLADETNPTEILRILKAYKVNSNNIDSNLILKGLLKSEFTKGVDQGGEVSKLMSGFGNTDVTVLAAGLARFLAERAKEEINEVFFEKMKKQLNSYPELSTAFPKTASFLNVIETYNYATIIQILKEAFEKDIQSLPGNLYKIKSLTPSDCNKILMCGETENCHPFEDCQSRLGKLNDFFNREDGQWIGLGMYTLKEAFQSSNPAELIDLVSSSAELDGIKESSVKNSLYSNYNLASSIELANLISRSLLSKDNNQIWIKPEELKELFKGPEGRRFKIYLGLLLAEELKGDIVINFYMPNHSPKTFGAILTEMYQKFNDYENTLRDLINNSYTAYNAVNNAVKRIIKATENTAEADPQSLYVYYSTFTSSFETVVHSEFIKHYFGTNEFTIKYDHIKQYLDPSVDLAYHIATKKYSAAIYDAVLLLGNENSGVFDNSVSKSFTKYGILISTMANAQSSDEVKQALEASVLPSGSYSIKRKTNWSMSINAYVGAYWNYQNSKNYLPNYGLSAPVSFNISKGSVKKNIGGLSLNLQVIDVGALVNYYLLKGDSATLPNSFNVRLSNVFAPGFNICYNIPRTPLSLAWGGQHIQTLYRYEQLNGKEELLPIPYWRWQISLLIDIPLFNLRVWD